jgi:hypothetical protein
LTEMAIRNFSFVNGLIFDWIRLNVNHLYVNDCNFEVNLSNFNCWSCPCETVSIQFRSMDVSSSQFWMTVSDTAFVIPLNWHFETRFNFWEKRGLELLFGNSSPLNSLNTSNIVHARWNLMITSSF